MKSRLTLLLTVALSTFTHAQAQSQAHAENPAWKPVPGKLVTRWAKDVTPENVWPQYPRPTMVREKWQNLNGLWDYAIFETAKAPTTRGNDWQGKILVPFPIESSLSGVGKELNPNQTLVYRRTFSVPPDWRTNGQRVLLHFGAVDWHAVVDLNGKPIGEHAGGFDPFSFDITDAIASGDNELVVTVTDPTDTGTQPRGKQWLTPGGIWYTRISGIWQTVWIEPVPSQSIRALTTTSDAATGRISVSALCHWEFAGPPHLEVEVIADGKTVAHVTGSAHALDIDVPNPRRWSPDDPFLYEIRARVKNREFVHDEVRSYAAIRDVRVANDNSGIPRILLNGQPIFSYGPLDQGFWPDGLYTPPTEEAFAFDIQAAKDMGCNMLRKHVKVEPEIFYTMCDRMGIMVWQDMPSPFFASKDSKEKLPALDDSAKKQFERELLAMIAARRNHPSIVMWVPWNEGWGQNDLAWSRSMAELNKATDPSRLVNNATGWTDMGVGDTVDIHAYPDPATPPAEARRAAVLGEFGGLGLPLEGHTWVAKNNWGYVSYKNKEELTRAYVGLLRQIPPLIAEGLCAAVYTQTSDVEIECNGWLTYDREIWKIDPKEVREATGQLYLPHPTVRAIVPRAGQSEARATWRYTMTAPAVTGAAWSTPGFDDSSWKSGEAGFGSEGTPGANIKTPWTTSEIWLRRTFDLKAVPENLSLSIHHDEDAEVYINGVLAAKLPGYTSSYRTTPIAPAALAALHAGTNTLAVHCTQTRGGQYIDCGLVEIIPAR